MGNSQKKEPEIKSESNLTFTAFGKKFVLSPLPGEKEQEREQDQAIENNPTNSIPDHYYMAAGGDWVRNKKETIWSPQGSGFFCSDPFNGTFTIYRWKNNKLNKFNIPLPPVKKGVEVMFQP